MALSPYKKLDLILAELWTPRTYADLKATITNGKHKEITKEQLEAGIEKLREDGYAYVVDDQRYIKDIELQEHWYVRQTYNGEMFFLAGGYEEQKRLNDLEKENVRTYNLRMETYTKRLATWTERLTYAGWGAAALVVVWGIVQYILEHSSRCH